MTVSLPDSVKESFRATRPISSPPVVVEPDEKETPVSFWSLPLQSGVETSTMLPSFEADYAHMEVSPRWKRYDQMNDNSAKK